MIDVLDRQQTFFDDHFIPSMTAFFKSPNAQEWTIGWNITEREKITVSYWPDDELKAHLEQLAGENSLEFTHTSSGGEQIFTFLFPN